MHLKEGRELQNGKYKIIRVLGQGGFGITYLAKHTILNKDVAIKEFFPKKYCGRDNRYNLTIGINNNTENNNTDIVENLKKRFLKEAQNIARLEHDAIIKIHDIYEENNTAYYVMDYLDGENLNEMVKQNGPLSESKALEYISKVGEALEYIHSQNMIHFDVKPANIIIRKKDDSPILIDFGLSKQYDNHGDATSTLLRGISHGYSPIEMYSGDNITFSPQVDVYSLAATLYYLLEGKTPPQATNLIHSPITFQRTIKTNVVNEIRKGMSLDKNKRHTTVGQFVATLIRFDNDEETIFISNANSESLFRLAKQGDADAQYRLGEIFNNGKGVEQDYVKAVEWYRKAAEQGNADAQNSLGIMYYLGKGVEQDYVKAVEWCRKAAEQGNADAQNNLGGMYYWGKGVKQDYVKAVEWGRKAAERGNASAQSNLGDMYYRGKGVEQDYVKAVEWYKKAAEQGYGWGQYNLGNMYYSGKGVEQDYVKAVEWYRKAAEQGNADAQNSLGNRYYWGKGVEQDYVKAVEWYRKAAKQGYDRGQYNLANMYYWGEGVKKDKQKAKELWKLAADAGNKDAKKKLENLWKDSWWMNIVWYVIGGVIVCTVIGIIGIIIDYFKA